MKRVSISFLESNLPAGSGFNCKWNITEKQGIFSCKTEYHCLSNAGYYDGFLPFVVIIDQCNPIGFKLHFTDRNMPYVRSLIKRYGSVLREYIDDTIATVLK